MDRFFSKLDLRDIKIKPEGNRFLPDEDDVESIEESGTVSVASDSIGLIERDHAAYESPQISSHVVSATYERVPVQEWSATVSDAAQAPSFDGIDRLDSGAEVLKVSAKSRPSAVAGAIAGVVRENGRAEVQAIGAGATNQAVKAIAIAREYLLETDIDAICVPAFIDVTIDNEERTAIRLVIERR